MRNIPKEFIAQVLERCDIAEVIGSRIKMQKRGHEFTACCPFHQEKTPSFTVSPQKQFFYCFGCHAHGNAIDFIMRYANMEFPETVESLAQSVGLELPTDTTQQKDHSELYTLMQQATDCYIKNLRATTEAIAYLKGRKITGKIAKQFAIGYAEDDWQGIINAIKYDTDDKGQQKLLLDCGLIIQKNNKTYDRFRKRIMFPIRNTRGKCIAFGGRVINNDDQPKYLNSPETAIFHKSNTLYGLYEAKQLRCKNFIVVEGYMDVVMLAQYGINGAVACLGTALTKQHIQTLQRYADTITLCFDGDNAGKRAAWRALETSLPLMRSDVTINFLELSDKHDPDSFVQQFGAEKFLELINSAEDIIATMFTHLEHKYPVNQLSSRIQFAESACAMVASMPKGLLKTGLIQEISQRSKIPVTEIENTVNNAASLRHSAPSAAPQTATSQNQAPRTIDTSELDPILTKLLAWTIYNPSSHTAQHAIFNYAETNNLIKSLQQCIQQVTTDSKQNTGILLATIEDPKLRTEIGAHLIKFENIAGLEPKQQWLAIADSWLQQRLDRMINALLQHGRQHGLNTSDKDRLQQLIKEKQSIE